MDQRCRRRLDCIVREDLARARFIVTYEPIEDARLLALLRMSILEDHHSLCAPSDRAVRPRRQVGAYT